MRFIRSAVLLGLLISPDVAAGKILWSENGHEIAFGGYLRAGVGASSGSPNQACFWAPGAAWKYRLGNECENYLSIGGLIKLDLPDNRFAEYFKYQFRTSIEGGYGEPFSSSEPILNFVEFGHIAGTQAKVWAGRREALLKDVYITDYNYMNTQGDGLGIYDLPIGSAKLYSSYIIERIYDDAATGKVYQHNLDFGIYDINTNKDGYIAVDLRLSRIFDNNSSATGIYDTNGFAVALRHHQANLWGGYNTLIAQYGRGAARSAFSYPFEPDWVGEKLSSETAAAQYEDAQTFRLLDTYFRDGENWAVIGLALFEYRHSLDFDGTDQTWLSIGARPTWFIDDHWRITAEVGFDYVFDRSDDTQGFLLKQSLALEWAPKRQFFSRPVWRAYVTRADWSTSFAEEIGWPDYSGSTNAWSAGLQVEYWW